MKKRLNVKDLFDYLKDAANYQLIKTRNKHFILIEAKAVKYNKNYLRYTCIGIDTTTFNMLNKNKKKNRKGREIPFKQYDKAIEESCYEVVDDYFVEQDKEYFKY